MKYYRIITIHNKTIKKNCASAHMYEGRKMRKLNISVSNLGVTSYVFVHR